jgi:hypothetical protein
VDETTPAGADWAWAAVRPGPLTTPPTIYYDPDGVTIFPPAAVMPLTRLRSVILEWADTAQRPASVDWVPINGLVWELTDDGRTRVPDPTHQQSAGPRRFWFRGLVRPRSGLVRRQVRNWTEGDEPAA